MAYQDDLRNAILAEAPRLGLSPVDIASIFSYETGGTFDPWKAGPTTQWGQHFGLFQAGEPQRKQYGLTEQMPVGDQVKAFMQYLTDTGVKYGAQLPELYSAVNAGSPDKLLARDARGNTVLEKLRDEFPAHRDKALALLGQAGTTSPNYRGGAARGVIAPSQQPQSDDPFAGLISEQPQELIMGPYEEAVSDDSTDPKSREFFDGSMATTFLSGRLTGGAAGRKDSVSGFQPSFRQGLAAMIQNAPAGVNISINSGYRSQELQDQLYAASLRKHHGDEAEARRWVAKHSRHTLGIAADLKFGDEKSQQWAHANAAKYGLTFRLGHEPWHVELANATGGMTDVSDPNFDSETFTDSDVGPIMNAVSQPLAPANGLIKPIVPEQQPYQPSTVQTFLQGLVNPGQFGANLASEITGTQEASDSGQPEKSFGETIEDKLTNLLAGTVDVATALPWKIGAGIVAPGEWAGRHLGELTNPDVNQDEIFSITDWLWNKGVSGEHLSEAITGADPIAVSGDVAARVGPGNVIMSGGPGGAAAKLIATEAATAIMSYGPEVISSLRDFVFGPAEALAPDPSVVVEPPGVDKAMYNTLGPLAILSGGLAALPYAISGAGRLAGYNKARLNAIPNAPRNAITMTKAQDVFNTVLFDSWRGVSAIMERGGIPKQLLAYIDDMLSTHTRAGAKAVATSAVVNGKANTVNRSFSVNTPIIVIEKAIEDQPVYGQYINILDILDQFRIKGRGTTTIKGETRRSANQMKRDIEAAHPKAIEVANVYREHIAELKRFSTSGPHGIIDPIGPGRPHYIPAPETTDPLFVRNPAAAARSWSEVTITDALQNEAKATIIDAFQNQSTIKQVRDGAMVPVTKAQLRAHPQWKPNIVNYTTGGRRRMIYTDDFMSDMLQIDPFSATSQLVKGAHGFKRMLEIGTTGVLAPVFALTAFVRNWRGILMTKPPGTKGPGLTSPFLAVPQVLIPKAARAMAETINASLLRDNGGFWNRYPVMAKSLSAMLSRRWTNSYIAQMEHIGTHAGTYLDDPMVIMSEYKKGLTGLMQMAQQPGRSQKAGRVLLRTMGALARGWSEIVYSVHGGPSFAWTKRNMKARPQAEWPHIVATGPKLTGAPSQHGQSYVKDRVTSQIREVRGPGWKPAKSVAAAVAEVGHVQIPWFDPILSGMGAMAKAYWRDPVRFTGRLWAYIIAPTIGTYLYNRSLGDEYTYHQMNERSRLKSATSMVIYIPGRPPSEGLEFPIPQELGLLMGMAETLIHYSLPPIEPGGVNAIEKSDALWDLAENFLWRVIQPPPTIMETAVFSGHGYNPPTGSFSNEGIHDAGGKEPFDQFHTLPAGIEDFIREAGGTIGQVFIEALNAAAAEQGTLSEHITNGLDELMKQQMTRVPFGAIIGAVPSMSTDTRIAYELSKKSSAIGEMSKYWDLYGQYYDRGREPEINIEPRSKRGGRVAGKLTDNAGRLGQSRLAKTAPYPGFPQPPPTNELYIQFMKEIHDKLMTDTKGRGVKGFLSLNEQLGNILLAQASIRRVNAGNFVSWAKLVQEDEDIRDAISGLTGQDRWDPERASNYLQHQRNLIEREILLVIKDVEADIAKRSGREIKLEDLSPYRV